jgi:prophage regulatory protein
MLPESPCTKLLRLPAVLGMFPVSRSHWWAGIAAGHYPKPVRIPGSRCVAWRAEDIQTLIASAKCTGGDHA